MSGWYVMRRGWMDSFKPEPFTEREAFLWSIEQAAYEAHDQWFNGQRIAVGRGEFATSLRAMSEAFSWSIKRVRGFMERMGKAQKWAQRQAHQGAQSPTIISVCNYAKYQDQPGAQGTAEGTAEGTQRAQSGHSKGTQQNKGNKGNKVEEEDIRPTVVSTGKPSDALVPVGPDPVSEAFEGWQALRHELRPNGRPIALTDIRRRKLASRLKEIGPDAWPSVLASIRGSPFLRGETERWGGAEIDWLLEPKNLTKVLEGNYDGTKSRGITANTPGGAVRTSPVDAMRIARDSLGFS